MSVQKKDARLELRLSSELKEELRAKAEAKEISLSNYLLDSVRTNNNNHNKTSVQNVRTESNETLMKLANAVLELNTLMRYNGVKGTLLWSDKVNEKTIMEGVKLARSIQK